MFSNVWNGLQLAFSWSSITQGFPTLSMLMRVIIIITIVIALAVWIMLAIGFANIAKNKGRNFVLFLLLCLFGGLPAYFYAWAVPQKEAKVIEHEKVEVIKE